MVTFLLCQSCVARIAPSLSPAVLDILMMVGGLSVWLTRGGNEGFLPVLCAGGWAWRDPRLSCAEPPPPPAPSVLGHTPCLSVGMKALGMWVFYGLAFPLPNGKRIREGLVKSVMAE